MGESETAVRAPRSRNGRVADLVGSGEIRQALERGGIDREIIDAIIELLGRGLAQSRSPRSKGGLSE